MKRSEFASLPYVSLGSNKCKNCDISTSFLLLFTSTSTSSSSSSSSASILLAVTAAVAAALTTIKKPVY